MEDELLQGKYETTVAFDIAAAIDPAKKFSGNAVFVFSTTYQINNNVFSEEQSIACLSDTLLWLRDKGFRFFRFGPNRKASLHIMADRPSRYGKDVANVLLFNGAKGYHVDLQVS